MWIRFLAHYVPPGSNTVNRKLSGVRADADIYPALVLRQVIYAIRWDLPQSLIRKVVHFHFCGSTFLVVFLACILELSDVLLLLGVDWDNRAVAGPEEPHFFVNVLELRVSIRMIRAFLALLVGLQTVVQIGKQSANATLTDTVAFLLQLIC